VHTSDGTVADGAGVEHREVAAVARSVVDEREHPTVAFVSFGDVETLAC
jgi:hypothetical protein